MKQAAGSIAAPQTGASAKQHASEAASEIVSVLYQAAIPELVVLIEHASRVIKRIQSNKSAQGGVHGNSIILDDVAPRQTLRNIMLDEYDLRLREATLCLLEAMKCENVGREQ